jgi:hypothetical protein
VRGNLIEEPVEDTGRDEGVDVANVETAQVRDVSVCPTKLRSTLASGKLFASKFACGEREREVAYSS